MGDFYPYWSIVNITWQASTAKSLTLIACFAKKKTFVFFFHNQRILKGSSYWVSLPKSKAVAKNIICISLVEKKKSWGKGSVHVVSAIYHTAYLGNKHSFPYNDKTSYVSKMKWFASLGFIPKPLYIKANHYLDHRVCFLKNIIDGNLFLKLFFI